jgi:hypothetical protein
LKSCLLGLALKSCLLGLALKSCLLGLALKSCLLGLALKRETPGGSRDRLPAYPRTPAGRTDAPWRKRSARCEVGHGDRLD